MVIVRNQREFDKHIERVRHLPFGAKVKELFRQSVLNIPTVVIGMPYFIVGVGIFCYLVKNHCFERKPKYRKKFTVYRPDDPRVANIVKDSNLD